MSLRESKGNESDSDAAEDLFEVLDCQTNAKRPLQDDEKERKKMFQIWIQPSITIVVQPQKSKTTPLYTSKCVNCQKCIKLSKELEKEAHENLQLKKEVAILKKEFEALKQKPSQIPLTNQELNFCIDSFKQIIHSYEEETEKLYKFLQSTLKIPKTTRTIFQVVESVTTDFMVSWREINQQIQSIRSILHQRRNQSKIVTENCYNFYQTMQNIQKIKEQIQTLVNEK